MHRITARRCSEIPGEHCRKRSAPAVFCIWAYLEIILFYAILPPMSRVAAMGTRAGSIMQFHRITPKVFCAGKKNLRAPHLFSKNTIF